MPEPLVHSVGSARRLAGTDRPAHVRSFRTSRPVREHHVTFQPTARALDEAATAGTLGAGVPFVDVPPDRRSQHALVARLGGEFQSLDELVVAGWAAGPSETVVRLALTRVESADGEPVPLDVFVILPLTPDLLQSARVRLTFTVQHRSHRGELAPTAASLPDCLVSLAAGVAER